MRLSKNCLTHANDTSLGKNVRQAVLHRWLMVPASLRRSLGIMADFLVSSFLTVTPYVFYCLQRPIRTEHWGSLDFSQPHSAAFFMLYLVITPLPLIALRFVCRIWLCSPTPGEMLSGYMILTSRTGLGGYSRQCRIGLLQYVFLFISAAPAFVIVLWLSSSLRPLPPFCWLTGHFYESILFLFAHFSFTLLFLWCGLGFDKENRSDLEQLGKASVKSLLPENGKGVNITHPGSLLGNLSRGDFGNSESVFNDPKSFGGSALEGIVLGGGMGSLRAKVRAAAETPTQYLDMGSAGPIELKSPELS